MVTQPHDALFRRAFGQPADAAPLLRALLPPSVAGAVDWGTLRALPGTRVDSFLNRHQTDLAWTVQSEEGPVGLLLVVEHSSRSDPTMAFRMLDYAVGLWRAALRGRPRPRRLPRVYALVVHHGRRPWAASMQLAELLGGPAPPSPEQETRSCYSVTRLRAMTPAQVENLAASVFGKLALLALRLLPGAGTAEVLAEFARWRELLRRLMASPSGARQMVALSRYVLAATKSEPALLIEWVDKEVNREASRIMKTAAAKLRQEGREEGRVEMLAGLIAERFGGEPDDYTKRLTSAAPAELDRIARRLLVAASLDELFAPE